MVEQVITLLAVNGLFTIPFALLVLAGAPTELALAVSLLAAAVVSTASAAWLWRLYHRIERDSEVGHSEVFGMLVTAQTAKVAFGVWIGYLIAANLLLPELVLPIPPAPARLIVNALAALLFLSTPVYYAVRIRQIRGTVER